MEDVKLEFPSLPQCKEDAEDWSYPMRREMQEVLPSLFLGPYSAAMKSKLSMLQKYGITHIVCIRQSIEANFIKPNFQHLFRYLVLDIADNTIENIIRFFPMTKEFIDGCLHSGGKVLIHGNAGISRSAALVIAYIMETFGVKYSLCKHTEGREEELLFYPRFPVPRWEVLSLMVLSWSSIKQNYRDAFTYVQERRFCINPNAGFVHQLQEYEAIYLAKLTIKMMSPLQLGRTFSLQSGAAGSLKRTLEEEDEHGNMQVSAAHEG